MSTDKQQRGPLGGQNSERVNAATLLSLQQGKDPSCGPPALVCLVPVFL